MYYVYILASRYRGTIYVGLTRNVARRMHEHKGGFVAGFTKAYKVDRLVHVEEFSSVDDARTRERTLKRWRREWKFQLVEKDNTDWKDLSPALT